MEKFWAPVPWTFEAAVVLELVLGQYAGRAHLDCRGTSEDRIPADLFNQVLWEGPMGGKPYPAVRNGQIERAAAPVNLHGPSSGR
jgi:hypothetical protein